MQPRLGDFEDVVDANRAYARSFRLGGLSPQAARGLAVVTCIDSRIEPLAMLGLVPGDAKIIRNAGARVTDDVLRSLVLATNLLGVRRVMVLQHTDCAVTGSSDEELRAALVDARDGAPIDPGFEPLGAADAHVVLAADVVRVRACTLLPPGIAVAGFEYDVATGELRCVVSAESGIDQGATVRA